jgi:hypothetical protein
VTRSSDNNAAVTAPDRLTNLFTARRVISSVLLAVAFAGLYSAFLLHDDAPNPRLRPPAVRTVSPEPGSLQLRQTEIFVELQPTYQGTLSVNGTTIPDDQLDVIDGLNRYSFTPGPDRELENLPPGRTCAEVTYVLVTGPDGEPGRYRWCFNVS